MRAEFRSLLCLRVFSRILIVAFAIAILASGAFTQSQTGTLIGLVYDLQHKVISGVDVQLSRVDVSQPVSHTVTDTKGRFKFVGLAAGHYSLELTHPAWQSQHLSHLAIDAARTVDVDIVLLPSRPTSSKEIQSDQMLDRDVFAAS